MAVRTHPFGGQWTEEKLERVRAYLNAYTTALKKQPFDLVYVDAFAGTGYRTNKRDMSNQRALLDIPHVNDLARGSAHISLEISDRSFDEYVFVEKNRNKMAELRKLEERFPDRADRMRFVRKDANEAIVELCENTDWHSTRAVMFLDPYGMQVDWATIEAIARTKAIDLWYLFASGMGVNRLLTRTGNVHPAWAARLDRMLGYAGWRQEFYERTSHPSLLGEPSVAATKRFDDAIADAFIRRRLGEIFAGVSQRSLPLRNSRNQTMYHLVFACGNPVGKSVALRIADHILKDGEILGPGHGRFFH